MTNRTRAIMEGIVDVVAIVGLIVLGALHVVDGAAILPLITLIAGGSIGARVSRRRPPTGERAGDDDGAPPGAHASILALAFAPFLELALHRAAGAVVLALVLVAGAASCGGRGQGPRRTTTAAACATLLVAIGEAPSIAPDRAEADRQTVQAVCTRYTDPPDAGRP